MGFPLKSNSTLDRGVHRICCSRGQENSKPQQANALSKSTKDHQTKSIQGRHIHLVGPLRLAPSTTWCTQAVGCHELRHFLHEIFWICLAQLRKYTAVGAANKVIRTQTCKRRGCSQVPVLGVPVREYSFSSYISLITRDAHVLWWQRGFMNAAERDLFQHGRFCSKTTEKR